MAVYKVKRFSQMTPEQREFNIFQDLYHSGAKRTFQKTVGRLRKGLTRKIDEKIIREGDNIYQAGQKYAGTTRVQNPRIERQLLRDAKGMNARTLGTEMDAVKGNYTLSSKNANDEFFDTVELLHDSRTAGKVRNAAKSADDLIFHPSGSGVEHLAHEVGHLANARSKNPIVRAINKRANSPEVREDLIRIKGRGKVGFGEAAKRYIDSKLVNIEEANASRNAIKMMKRHGASKDEIETAKETLKAAGQTYVSPGKVNYLFPLRDKIAIPSNRVANRLII